jgi:UDP-N-acetylmuramoylalanine--D-glutamate ligase
VVLFSRKEKLKNGVIYDEKDKNIKIVEDGEETIVINTKDIILRGLHNYENVCAAVAACKSIVDIDIIKEAIKKFKPVEHRLEFVREIDGVKWYNDSIGSSPSRTIAGVNSYDERIVLIAGGYDKNLDYKPLAKPVIEKVDTLVLMGQTADKIEKAIRDEGKDKELPNIIHANSLEDAVNKARENAKPGNVVLFSPAAASFDLFKNFMERGNKFKEIVNNLK